VDAEALKNRGARKQTRVLSQLKKQTLNPDTASFYRPMLNFPYLSEVIERVVARRFIVHTHQFCIYFPFSNLPTVHSTLLKTTVLSVHNDLVRAIDTFQISTIFTRPESNVRHCGPLNTTESLVRSLLCSTLLN
jgi:hypothetical protein